MIRGKGGFKERKLTLESWIEQAKEDNDKMRLKALKAIARSEAQNEAHKIIKRITMSEESDEVDCLDIQDAMGRYKRISERGEMEEAMKNHFIEHFHQAHRTAFSQQKEEYQPLNDDIIEAILKGEWKGDSPSVNQILNQLRENLGEPQVGIDESIHMNMLQGLHRWRESTSTSPSGRHLGHYKALLRFHKVESSKGNRENKGQRILKIITTVARKAFEFGISLKRWECAISCVIPKTQGCPRIDKLRIIHLFEADFNLLLKLMWGKKLIKHVEQKRLLTNASFGSRPNRAATDELLLKEMTYSYALLTRTNLGEVFNDAKSCYDRIIPFLARIVARYYGMQDPPTKTLATCFNNMKYTLKIRGQLTKSPYHNTETKPLYGIGQGSGASPAIWVLLLDLITKIKAKHSVSDTMADPSNKVRLSRHLDIFVDDSSVTGMSRDNRIIQKLQIEAELWEELLASIGGKLEFEKTCYTAIEWECNEKGEYEATNPTGQLHIMDTSRGERTKVKYHSPQEEKKILGTYQSITGENSREKQELTNKCSKYAIRLYYDYVDPHTASMIWNNYITPMITYASAAHHFTRLQWENIIKEVVRSILLRFRLACTFPRAILFGPKSRGGLGLAHPKDVQLAKQIQAIRKNVRLDNDVGKAIRINLAWTQIMTGLTTPIFEKPSSNMKHVRSNWIQNVCEGMYEAGLSISIDDAYTPRLQRENDKSIIDCAIELNQELRQRNKTYLVSIKAVNRCRLYMKVTTLADIVCANGIAIREKAYRLVYDEDWSTPTREYPKQERLKSTDKTHWHRLLKSLCRNRYRSVEKSMLLRQSLGRWMTLQERKFTHMYVPTTNTIVHRIQGKFYESFQEDSKIYNYQGNDIKFYSEPIRECDEPTRFVPVDGYIVTTLLESLEQETDSPITIKGKIKQLNERFKASVESTRGEMYQFSDESKFVLLVSDASVRYDEGTFAWIATNEHNSRVQATGSVHGEGLTSYRAEALGILHGILAVHHLRVNKKHSITMEIVCDNEAVLKMINKFLHSSTVLLKVHNISDSDVMMEIKQVLVSEHTTIITRHVKGHADRSTNVELTLLEKLNIECDKRAASRYNTEIHNTVVQEKANSGNKVQVHKDKQVVNSNVARKIQEWASGNRLEEYTSQRFRECKLYRVDWEVLNAAIKGANTNKLRFAVRFIFDLLPSNQTKYQRGHADNGSCKLCGKLDETNHFMKCEHSELRDWRRATIIGFEKLLANYYRTMRSEIRACVRQAIMEAEMSGCLWKNQMWKGRWPITYRLSLEKTEWHEYIVASAKIIRYLWSRARAGWDIRNEAQAKHCSSQSERQILEEHQARYRADINRIEPSIRLGEDTPTDNKQLRQVNHYYKVIRNKIIKRK